MKWHDANQVVENLRKDTRLYLPALTKRRGFSSSRVEHLLNGLVKAMPETEYYLEVGTLEGRTLEAASVGNEDKAICGCDPCEKYDMVPEPFSSNVLFVQGSWRDVLNKHLLPLPVGLAFYDGDHSQEETGTFMFCIKDHMADEAVLVLDDWDRESVRRGAFAAAPDGWTILREMPCYGDGLTCPQQHFGYSFGVAVWGFRR